MSELRKTTQYLIPVEKEETGNGYDIYPVHELGPDKIQSDYLSLAKKMSGFENVIIDGYVGADRCL